MLIYCQRRPCRNNSSDPYVELFVIHPIGRTLYLTCSPVQRDPRYFWPEPETFWPERWLPDQGPKIAEARGQEFRLDQNAYMPFSYGAFLRWEVYCQRCA
jgi:hypothetical protein